ncbi:hypothetical protein [Liquorilactobacillus cacaonum]|uniref:hypothetical protein n=1 Tax=Liquorilactobacillus cacaonum TaxID=483012 RepID=UPI00070EB74C|nr:hypothetical protein [Liquorilactobacillus cacaonum]
MNKLIKSLLLYSLALTFLIPITAHAELIGHYSWGYFYSVMTSKTVTSEVDATTNRKVRAVAQNNRRTAYGPLVAKYKGSLATVARTSNGNKTFYRFY